VMCHPGFVDAELQRLDDFVAMREQEYAFLAGERFPRLLAAHGMALA
jgi:chitin disaccharide deacetylase